MISILALAAGILLMANDHVFGGAQVVGFILTAYGAFGVFLQFVLTLFVALVAWAAGTEPKYKTRKIKSRRSRGL